MHAILRKKINMDELLKKGNRNADNNGLDLINGGTIHNFNHISTLIDLLVFDTPFKSITGQPNRVLLIHISRLSMLRLAVA